MKIEEHIRFWIDGADHDLDTAEGLFSAEKFDWCLFLGHLVLELSRRRRIRVRKAVATRVMMSTIINSTNAVPYWIDIGISGTWVEMV